MKDVQKNSENKSDATKEAAVPSARHGLRLIKTPCDQMISTDLPRAQLASVGSDPVKTPKRPSALVSQLKSLADSIDAEVEMILRM